MVPAAYELLSKYLEVYFHVEEKMYGIETTTN